jgi:hypothetical protein
MHKGRFSLSVIRQLVVAVPLAAALLSIPTPGFAATILLPEPLASFAVLGAAAGAPGVTNASGGGTAATIINGNLGVFPGTSTDITGFPPGIVNGTIQPGTVAAAQGQLTTAYNDLGLLPITSPPIGGGGLSGLTLGPGVYDVASTAFDLATNSTLTLDGSGDPNGQWVFRMSSSLITGVGTTVDVSSLGPTASVFWVVRSSATLGDNADFAGNILALTSIAFDPGATDLCGRALARNGLVSFAGVGTAKETGEGAVEPNQVGGGCFASGSLNGGPGPGPAVPEPATLTLLGIGLVGVARWKTRRMGSRQP